MNTDEALKYLKEKHGVERGYDWMRQRTGNVGEPGKLFPTRYVVREDGKSERDYVARELDAVGPKLPKVPANRIGGLSGSGVGNVLGTRK